MSVYTEQKHIFKKIITIEKTFEYNLEQTIAKKLVSQQIFIIDNYFQQL